MCQDRYILFQVSGDKKTYKTGIVENDESFLSYLVPQLDRLETVATPVLKWTSGEAFLADENLYRLELLFLDIDLGGISGVQIAARLQQILPGLPIIILSNLTSDEAVFDAIRFGIKGYILKSDLSTLPNAIDVVTNGGAMMTPTIALRVMNTFQKSTDPGRALTERENQILDLMVRGKTIPSVAEFLMLSPHTVHGYVKTIYKKLEVHNRAELVMKAKKNGWIV